MSRFKKKNVLSICPEPLNIFYIMKNLLFLVGLIMVATACTSSGSSFGNKSKEESKESNISFLILKKHKNGVCDYGFCFSNYDASSQTLNFDLNGQQYSFELSQIKEEYYDQVKKNKVTLLIGYGEPIPAIVEKDETKFETPPVIEKDERVFVLHSILKDRDVSKKYPYTLIYNGLFLNGFCNAGIQSYENGRFFFSEIDSEPEYDDSKSDKGYISAGLALYDSPHEFCKKDKRGEYRYALVQTYCEDGYLILKIENGQIYRYPLNIFDPEQRNDLPAGKPISALQMANLRWVPIYLLLSVGELYNMGGSMFQANNSYNLRQLNNLSFYFEFMSEMGMDAKYRPLDDFYYYAKPK